MPQLSVHLEITPPRDPRPDLLLRRADCLGERATRIHVIQRPGRWSSVEASAVLLRAGREPVWHLANRGRSVAELEEEIARAAAAGIPRVLCVRGEYKREDREDTPKIREVVRMLRRRLPRATVGVTLDPFAARAQGTRERALRNLRAKLAAGAGMVQTQVCFELESLRPFAAWAKETRPGVEVWPMMMPVESPHAALRLSRRLRVPLPPALVDRLDRFGPEAGWEHFASLARAVHESPLFDGLTVMTPIDPTPDFGRRLRAAIPG